MTGAKKLIDEILSKLAASTHRNWPFQDTISVFGGEFRRLLAAFDRCMLNKGAFAFKIVQWALKWPLKGGSRLIQVAATAGLTVNERVQTELNVTYSIVIKLLNTFALQ